MSSRTHPANRHHCNNLSDLIPLLGQMGYTVGEKHDDENSASVTSVEKRGLRPAAKVSLNKQDGSLTCTDEYK